MEKELSIATLLKARFLERQAVIDEKPLDERCTLLKEILQVVNAERFGTTYKPTTGKRLAIQLSHIPTKDLYYITSQARDMKNRGESFSKYLFWAIKVKKQ